MAHPALPPLYKYLNVEGAKLTLGNNTFKHSKPSDFNDAEDLTIQSIFPEDVEVALKKLSNSFTDVILKNLDKPPTCGTEQMRGKLALIQKIYRENPQAAEAVKAQIKNDPKLMIFDVEKMRGTSKGFIDEINAFMQGYRVLCVSTLKDSERMWQGYAQNHQGIVLRIQGNAAKDSKFQWFRPVTYRATRPPLYDNTLAFLEGSLFGDQEATKRAMLEKIVYSKTLPWQHESEYRLAIPLRAGEPEWNTLSFHPEEIPELYLGSAMTNENRNDIVAKVQALNPDVAIFQVSRGAGGKFTFTPV